MNWYDYDLMKKSLWSLGIIEIFNPYALADAMKIVISLRSKGVYRYTDRQNVMLFGEALIECGIVKLGSDDTFSVGRKWRSALNKLGFLYPEVSLASGITQSELGPVDMITPNGWRLVRADTVPAMQECFLRALAACYIPSPLEKEYSFSAFSPLRHTLAVMLELERQTGESRLNFIEMALIVQLTSSDNPMVAIVSQVLALRADRLAATNKRHFDRDGLSIVAAQNPYAPDTFYQPQTFNDYADTNLRYLKATGLVQSKGRGISLVPEKHLFVETLVQDSTVPDSDREYFVNLCNGAALPTDHQESALLVLSDLLQQLKLRGIPFCTAGKPTNTPADIAIIRYQIESLLSERKEEEYAMRQGMEWEEIAAYMELIVNRRSKKTLASGEEIVVPQSEAPAYFEWILWRAFLAINSLKNTPYEARRFKIDQDFLPVGTAPGGGPDLIFEFSDFVIVVEVTLTDYSRQEAVEGESVRRHVADLVLRYHEQSGKPVYGLFIANRIDSNTAETFRIGIWFTRSDDKMRLDIIPFTLAQFKEVFEALFTLGRIDVSLIRELLDHCGALRPHHEAPAWKREIERCISHKIATWSQV